MTKDEFDRNVKQWARERGIIPGSTVGAQLGKTLEEIGELWQAIAACDGDAILDAFGDIDVTLVIAGELCEYKSGITPTPMRDFAVFLGDIAACRESLDDGHVDCARSELEVISRWHGIDIAHAREHAWNQIKDRTGKLVDGVFVKDA